MSDSIFYRQPSQREISCPVKRRVHQKLLKLSKSGALNDEDMKNASDWLIVDCNQTGNVWKPDQNFIDKKVI